MALPGDITTITLTGSFSTTTGAPAGGTVSIAPTTNLTDSTGQVILTAAPQIQTLISGAFSVVLPCTDNVSIRPTPFEYLVTPAVPFAFQEPFAIRIPSTLGATVDLSSLWPVPQPPSPVNGIYVISVNGQSGSVNVAPYNLPGTGAATRWAGATATGPPVSGTFLVGDWVIAQDGHIWICTGAGTPGTWVQA